MEYMANSKGKFLLAGLLGAAAGALGGILLAPQSGKKTRSEIASMANTIMKQIRLGVVETEHKVKDIYGETTKSAKASYEKIKNTVALKVASVKEAGEKIDKDKYLKIVDDVIGDFKSDFETTKNGAEKMKDFLHKDWEKVKKAITPKETER